jgi:hypothetical protein
MGIENAEYIDQLNASWPTKEDAISDGDNHIRLIKKVLQQTFPGSDQPQAQIIDPQLDEGSIVHNNGGKWTETTKMTVDPSGNVSAEGDITAKGNVLSLSDDRLKDVQRPVSDALDKVKMLDCFHFLPNEKGVDHGMKNDPQVGVSAQQVQAVLPECVSTDGDYLRVDYPKLTVLLLAAVKELANAG